MKNLISFVYHALLLFLYPFGFLVPRKKNLSVLAAGNNAFAGNPKHLFFYLSTHPNSMKPVWITKDENIYKQLKSKNLAVEKYYSWRGIYTCLRAKYYFYNMSLSDLNFYTSAGAKLINLWHGTPIKKIGKDASTLISSAVIPNKKPNALQRIFLKLNNRIKYPYHYVEPFIFTSSSKFTTDKIFKSAFPLEDKKYLPIAYPRSDIFFRNKDQILSFINQYEPPSIQKFITEIKSFERVYFYLPTFRDSDRDFFIQAGINLEQLNESMKKNNAVFVFKMHPKTNIDLKQVQIYSNLKVLSKEADIYTIIPFTDCLVTDYSSVYFDYLLLEKDIILFPFDLETYLKDSRSLYFDFQSTMKGMTAYSFEQLLAITINNRSTTNEIKTAQKELRQLFWDDYNGNAAADLISYLEKT